MRNKAYILSSWRCEEIGKYIDMVLIGITTNAWYAPKSQNIAPTRIIFGLLSQAATMPSIWHVESVGKEEIYLQVGVKAPGTPAARQLADVVLLNSGDQGGGDWRRAVVAWIHGELHRG
jgi:hypothetical protein